MREVSNPCKGGSCPKAIDPEDGTDDLLIQGYDLDEATRAALGSVPAGEHVVRVPRAVIEEAARALAGAS